LEDRRRKTEVGRRKRKEGLMIYNS
jgi:hypothetical protein